MSVVTTGQITIADLNDAVSATLSNETFVAPSNPDGSGSDLTGAATTMKVFLGGEDDSANWTVAASASSGVTGSLSGKTYTVSSLTANSGYVDLTASRIGFPSITRRFSLSKARKGNRGSVTTARSISGTAWSNTEAATAISDAIADSPADGDMVTQYNSAQKFSETRVRKNAAWTKVTEFFGGDVMVKGSLTASKITIGDTSNMIPDPDFRDTESWLSDITGFSFANGTSFEAADRVCLINGFTSTGSANGYAGEIKTTTITVEPETDYAVSVVFRSNSTNTEGVIQLVWVEYNNAGAQVGYTTLGSVEMGSTAPVKISGRIKTAATGARGVFRVRLQRNAAGNFMGTVRFYNPVMRRAVSGELIVDGAITAKQIAAEAITASKIRVGDTQNLIQNGDFSDGLDGWARFMGSVVASDEASGPSRYAVILTRTTTENSLTTVANFNSTTDKTGVAVNAGDRFYMECWVYSTVAGPVTHDMVVRRPGGVLQGGAAFPSVSVPASTWTKVTGNATITQSGKLFFRLQNMIDNSTLYVSNVRLLRRNAAELIVDGSIEGKHIGANTIKAKHLEIGSRNLTLTGIAFEHNSPSSNKVSWTAGAIRYVDDAGVVTSKTITASNATWSSGVLYIYWVKGATVLSTTTNQSTAFDDDNVLLATYEGGIKLDADYGRTIIDGSAIKTGTIDVGKLDTTSFTNAGMSVFGGVLKSDDFAVGDTGWRIRATGEAEFESLIVRNKNLADDAITADKVMIGDYTNLVPNGNFSDNALITAHWSGVTGPGIARYLSKADDASYTQTGERSLLLQKNIGSENSSVSILSKKFIPVEGGADYYAETAIRTNQTEAVAGAWFRIIWYDHAKAQIGLIDVATNAPITASWVKRSKKVVAPTGAAFARFQLYNTDHQTTTRNLFFDRLIFRRANAAELIVDGSIKGVHIESDTIDTGHLKTDSIKASKLKIGDTSNMVPDPDFNDVAAWDFPITGYSFVNGTAAEATNRMCLINGLVSTGTASGFLASLNTKLVTVEPLTDYFLAVVFRGETGVGEGVAQLFYQERDYAGEILSSQNLGTYNLGSSTPVKLSGRVKSHANAASAQLRIRLQRNAAGNFNGILRFYNPIMRRAVSAELIVNGSIDATKVTTGELITVSAQIKDATIVDAHITNLSAAKLLAGTALVGSLTVSGKALSALKSDAELGASDPGTRINAGVTKINPGQITISGGTTLANWRGSDTTKINGGAIQTNTVTLEKLAAGTGRNLLMNTAFSTMLGWSRAGSGGVHSASVLSKREGGGDWAGGNYPVLMLRQTGTATDGYTDIASRHITLPGTEFAGSVPVKPGAYYEASAQISTHRCGGVLLIMFFDRNSAFISQVFSNLGADVQGSSTNPDDWVRYVVRAQAPANAAYAGITARKYGTTSGGDSYLFFHKPQIIETVAGATQTAPYSPGGYTFIDGGSIITDSIEADRIKAGVITADKMNTQSFTNEGLSLFGGALQSDNYVPNTSGWRISKLGVAEFEDLTVRSKNIEAEAVTASKLKMGDLSNMVVNDWSRGSTDGWTIGGQIAFTFATNTLAHSGWRLESNARDQAWSPFVPCTPGEWYYVSAWVNNHAAEDANLVINSMDGNGANAFWGVVGTATKEGWVHLKGWWQAPGGATRIRLLLQVAKSATGGNSTYWTKPVMRRATDRNMVVDGEITADKLNVQSLETRGLSVFGGSIKSDNYEFGNRGWRISNNGVAEFEDLIVRSKNIDLNAVSKLREVTLVGVTGATGNGSWVTAGSYAFNPEGDDPVSIWLCALGALTPGSSVYGQLDVRILFRGTERVLYEGAASWLGANTGRTMINIADRVASGGSSSGTISIQAKANVGTFSLKNIRLLLGEFKR